MIRLNRPDTAPRRFRYAISRLPRRATTVLVALVMILPAACSRSVAIATTPAITFAINVTNASGSDLAVHYDDGAGPRALGLVIAGRTERFIIAAPRSTTVTVSGTTPDGTRSAADVEVHLQAGTAVDITLR